VTAMPVSTMRGGILGLYAQTAVHPGSGTALGTVDLPVQREWHTHWPNTAGSALKGILRDACREKLVHDKGLQDEPADPNDTNKRRRSRRDIANEEQAMVEAFGPSANSASEAAGALSVTDARLLTFPVRSLKGFFARATCPMALDRLKRDAALLGLSIPWEIPELANNQAAVSSEGCGCLVGASLVLEEFEFAKASQVNAHDIAVWIASHLLPTSTAYADTVKRFPKQFVILHDDDFTHFARHATEVVARVGLNYETKTVREGALFYQEFLPAETLLYAVVLANAARVRFGGSDAAAILKTLTDSMPSILQIGGDETTGKGYCATRLLGAGE
jgi:CRISPR-associated protein Cmr4